MSIELANPDIVGALIGAAASLLTAIVTVALSRWLGDRDLKVLGGSTRSNVEGRWTGHFVTAGIVHQKVLTVVKDVFGR